MLTGVQVHHELDKRAVHTRQLAIHYGKARAGNLTACVCVKLPDTFTQLHVIFDRELKFPGSAPALDLHVIVFACASGHL